MSGVRMKIGFWPEFTKDEQKRVRRSLKGPKATGLATPHELLEWAKRVLTEALEDLERGEG